MNFLNFGLELKAWKPQTARTYLAAVLQYFPHAQQQDLRKDENLLEFLRVMGNNTLKHICHHEIDLDPIFSAIQAMGNNTTMSTKQLTSKTCFLLGLIGFLRPDDLACVDAAQCQICNKTLELVIVLPKERWGRQPIIKTVLIWSHTDEILCPVKAYQEYRRHMAIHDDRARRQHHKFDQALCPLEFTPLIRDVSYGTGSMGAQRISKYLGILLELLPQEVGQSCLKIRALAASNALRKGVPIDDVTTQGNWSSSALVEGYYHISR
ncbi:hypothetical protein CPC16_004443 [Podila verticillata]|nr:hypothetical protein CPC16_004443 [Podila verticillata]